MAEETKPTVAETEQVAVLPVAEEPNIADEAEKVDKDESEKKIGDTTSFKEESNKVDDLIYPEKKALDEFKSLIQEALNNHEFTAPKKQETKTEEKTETPATDTTEPPPEAAVEKVEEMKREEKPQPCEILATSTEEEKADETKTKEKTESCEIPATDTAAEVVPPLPPGTVAEKAEEIKETTFQEVTNPPPCEEVHAAAVAGYTAEEVVPRTPEEVSIWGVKLLADDKSEVILLKFLRARDFKVKDAFAMLKSVVAWRKEFKIDELLEKEFSVDGLEKVVYMNGVDKEGHPVCYNCFGEFQDKDLYSNTFADAEKRETFLKWYILSLEKSIRKLDFSPDGTCTIVQITDLKNSPGLILFKKELRQATNQALQLLQDNYPEFVAKQVFINVPWWYVAYNRMISPFLTQRTKSKFVFAGPTKTTETLFKYIAPEQVPVQYGGLNKEGAEFSRDDVATEEIIKPGCKHTVELPITEASTLVWEARVVGWEISYGAEFDPSAEGSYTWIVQKPRKIGPTDEQVISCTFKIGEPGKIVLTFDNQTSKKKKLLYRYKTSAAAE